MHFFFFSFFLSDIKQQQQQHGYDTGIGSTTTLMSPIGSPQPACRSHVKTNGHFTSYMQVRVVWQCVSVCMCKKNYYLKFN